MSESDEGAIFSSTRQKAGRLAATRAAPGPPPAGTKVPAATTSARKTVVLGSESDRDRRSQAGVDTAGPSAKPAAPHKRVQTRAVTAVRRIWALRAPRS